MKIVRGNTLPDYSLLSIKAGSAEIDGYQHHEKWQYKPIMGVNVEDVTGEDIVQLSEEEHKAAIQRISNSKLIPSLFNLERTFDDGTTIMLNTMTEAVASLDTKGYCSYLKRCANEARKRKIPVISKIFLHREILGEIDSVIDEVAQFSDVIICAFMEYSGNAKDMENDFLTIDDYDGLSDRVKEYIGASYLKKFKTEKEWIELSNKGNFPQFNIVDYVLYVDADNINKILTMSNDEIIEEFRKMNKDFQASFGEISELSEQYGDDNCEILYECRDILRKWLDKYYLDHNLDKGKLFSFTNSSVECKVYERL